MRWQLGHMNPQLPGVLRVNVPESRAALLPLLSDVLICRSVECIFGPCVDRVSLLSPFVMQAAHQGVAADNSAAHVLVKFGVHFHGALRWPNSTLKWDNAPVANSVFSVLLMFVHLSMLWALPFSFAVRRFYGL